MTKTYEVRNYDGSVTYSEHEDVDEALDARTGGQTVWVVSEAGERELTESEIF